MSDGMRRELVYLSSHATNRYFIPNWGINTLLNIGEDEVASAWATGHIHRDHRFDNLLNRAKHQRNFVTGININE